MKFLFILLLLAGCTEIKSESSYPLVKEPKKPDPCVEVGRYVHIGFFYRCEFEYEVCYMHGDGLKCLQKRTFE